MQGYLVTNTVNEKRYVGKTTLGIAHRWEQHIYAARRGSNLPLHRAIRKYGKKMFTVEPLMPLEYSITAEGELNEWERLMIRLIRKTHRLYNLTDGGEGAKGCKRSKETRRKIGAAQKGHVVSEETKRKMSDTCRRNRRMKRKRNRVKINITVDPDLMSYVKRTGRRTGVSERINQLLAKGIESEKIEKSLKDFEREK